MPMMQRPIIPQLDLKPTGEKTNLLGFVCEKYELRRFGQVMEIWATDRLLPFQGYAQHQPHRFGAPTLEERWSELLKAKKLFPLLAVLRWELPTSRIGITPVSRAAERYRFEVKSVSSEPVTDESFFLVPAGYHEIQPLPF